MQISPINSYSASNKNPGFKSAFPVVVRIGETMEASHPAGGKELNEKLLRKFERLLNDSLKKGVDPKRDALINKIREKIGKVIKDFKYMYKDKIKAFTCVDGEYKKETGELAPYRYFATGDTKRQLEDLGKDFVDAKNLSRGYYTGDETVANYRYYNLGKQIVQKTFIKSNPSGRGPEALHICFKPVGIKNNETIYEYVDAVFRPVENAKDPIIKFAPKP